MTRQTNSSRVWKKYKSFQERVKTEMKHAYWNYVNQILSPKMEENPKVFWRFVKGLRRDSAGIAALRHDGVLVSEGDRKSEILNNYFGSVFT